MPFPDEEHTGTRIAHHRKRAGLTQRGLAQKIPYSYSLLTQVESGHKSASPDLVAAVAKALCIDVTALTGQPYVTELQQDRLAELIRPTRYHPGARETIRGLVHISRRTPSLDHLAAWVGL